MTSPLPTTPYIPGTTDDMFSTGGQVTNGWPAVASTPSSITLPGPTVQVTVPKAFVLTLRASEAGISNPLTHKSIRIKIPAGVQMLPALIANHVYAVANGVK